MTFVRIPLAWMQPHIDGVARQGISSGALLSSSCIEPKYGDARDQIAPSQALLVCVNSVVAIEDATHGLARRGMRPIYPALGLTLALGRSTLEGGIQALSKLYVAESSSVQIKLQTEQDSAIVSVQVEARDERDAVYLEEVFLMWLYMVCSRF